MRTQSLRCISEPNRTFFALHCRCRWRWLYCPVRVIPKLEGGGGDRPVPKDPFFGTRCFCDGDEMVLAALGPKEESTEFWVYQRAKLRGTFM